MRYLGENPWDRLEIIKEKIGNSSKLSALSRGRNLFGYNPYPDEIIEAFAGTRFVLVSISCVFSML